MRIDTHSLSVKFLALLVSAAAVIILIFCLSFSFYYLDSRDFDSAIRISHPYKIFGGTSLHIILPALLSIIILELRRIHNLSYYLISPCIGVLIFLLFRVLWIHALEPYLESLKPETNSNFGNITGNPEQAIRSTPSYIVWVIFMLTSALYSYLYWFITLRNRVLK